MSVLRIVTCNVPGCKGEMKEPQPNAGWAGWGLLQGKQDDKTGETTFHLCPEHLNKTFDFVTKEA